MKVQQHTASLLLRLAMGATFLSAVASRLGLWGRDSSGWQSFVSYTAEVNSFIPRPYIPAIAMLSTLLESVLGLLLITGFKTRLAALASGSLTCLFALAMGYSFGIKSPLDYSVFVDAAACFLLAGCPPGRYSLDYRLTASTHANP